MMKLLSLLMASASAETVATAETGMTSLPLLTKGLIVTAGGLCGVFLVLLLFFITIKLMQKIK
ncbi:MAG TPA: hypothetical protein IAD38_03895 [Candidatus Egerieenecus merdigallinarum]|nr:hypothetical protein [Candidatus Egerieenecus merdigallinarum]